MHDLAPIKDRDKPLVRLHPDLYLIVKNEAQEEGIGKTEALDQIVLLGLALKKALRTAGDMAS